MPRDHARVNLGIWNDDDWLDLPPMAQHLYLVLWTHPDLSYAGVVDWNPARLAAKSSGWTAEDVILAGKCLESRLFIVIDETTGECLIRSWVRWDGLMKQPIMAVSFANARAAVASREIKAVIVHEAQKLHRLEPTLAGWQKKQVQELLAARSLDPRDRDLPSDPLTPGLTLGLTPSATPGLGVTAGVGVNPSPNPGPTPTPSPTPSLRPEKPEKESPSEKPRRPAEPDGFVDFWKAYPRRDDKGHARTAWVKAAKKAAPERIIEGAHRYAASVAGKERQFVALPSTWLNGERWDDEPTPPSPGGSRPSFWDKEPPR